jgi:hypothetical protein
MKRSKVEVQPPQPKALRKYFFQGNSAIAVSDLVVCMAVGTVMPVDRVPTELLPAVVLLATVGLREFNQQIIDDYEKLLHRLEEVIKHKEERDALAASLDERFVPEPWPWHPQLYLACSISQRGPCGEYTLNEIPEAGYIFQVYEELINATPEELFKGIA